ncbi:MAG: hypothetical protein O2887_17320 [Bacteroidetes bacterium]|nr:hypothetical protein [Bacteroidota bacterium]MDA1122219.1 hypothetical protein [Bacteroidota bacterium]
MKILSASKDFLVGLIILPLLLLFQCQDVVQESDSTTEDDPISSMIMTLKADNQMLDVFIEKVLSDPKFENKFLHHPWMIESLGRDSLFVNRLIDLLLGDSQKQNSYSTNYL